MNSRLKQRLGNEDWNTCCTLLPCDRALAAVLYNAVRMSHGQERQPDGPGI